MKECCLYRQNGCCTTDRLQQIKLRKSFEESQST
nr:MAG TPA: hypothetical protein [Caudoviricetes sp.]